MKNKIVILLVLLLVIPLVNGEIATQGTFKKNGCVELKQICGSCTYSKITSVSYPNSSIAASSIDMTTTDNIEWTYSFCNTKELGNYIVNGYADVDTENTPWAYDFNITTTGKDGNTLVPLILWLGAFAILGIALYQRNEFLGFFSGSLFIVAGIYTMIYGLGYIADDWTRTTAYVSLGIGLILGFASMYELFAGAGEAT